MNLTNNDIDINNIFINNSNYINYRGIPLEEVYNVFINYYYKSSSTLVFLFSRL